MPGIAAGAKPRVLSKHIALDRSEMLQETLRSVFTQTRAVDEIIVVDNGTQPPTISAEYAPRVKVIRLSSH